MSSEVATLPQGVKPKRIRKRSGAMQLQIALDASQALDSQDTNELTISRMKFMQARILTLNQIASRQHGAKLKKLKDTNHNLRAETERLKAEVVTARAEIQRLQSVQSKGVSSFGASLDSKFRQIEQEYQSRDANSGQLVREGEGK